MIYRARLQCLSKIKEKETCPNLKLPTALEKIIPSLEPGSPRAVKGPDLSSRVGVDICTGQILALTRRLCCRHCFSVLLDPLSSLCNPFRSLRGRTRVRVRESGSNPRTAIAPRVLPDPPPSVSRYVRIVYAYVYEIGIHVYISLIRVYT